MVTKVTQGASRALVINGKGNPRVFSQETFGNVERHYLLSSLKEVGQCCYCHLRIEASGANL